MNSDHQPQRDVVVGVLLDGDTVLLCQRAQSARYALKWEFPGGKVEAGETDEEALARELWEELRIQISDFALLHVEQSEYADGGRFRVAFYLVRQWIGACDNQVFESVQWLSPQELGSYDILEGNVNFCRSLPQLLATARL